MIVFINVQKLHEKNNEKHNAFTILILLQLLDEKKPIKILFNPRIINIFHLQDYPSEEAGKLIVLPIKRLHTNDESHIIITS